jgi:hypothetical protein
VAKLMLTLRLDPRDATLARVRRKLKLGKDEVDRAFGLVSLRPEEHTYAILVEETAAARLSGAPGGSGPFSNPVIEPFGPPTSQ